MRWLFLITVAVFMGFGFMAMSPLILDGPEKLEKTPMFAVAAPPEKKPEEEKPEEKPVEDALAKLAPESFQTDPQLMSAGFGMGYGSGGPALGSAMGLGGNMDQMVRDQTSVDRPARVVFRGQLNYPTEARNRGLTGTVTLRMQVEATGSLGEVKVDEATPPGIFENAAIAAVRQWRFDPAFIKGQPSVSWLVQKIRFEMN